MALGAIGTMATDGEVRTALAADAPVPQGCAPLDLSKGQEIGAAWRAVNPGADLQALRAELLPQGVCEQALEALGKRVRDDFRNGRIFVYRGWRLAETEGRLFALVDH
jgi:hypothetical protein